MKPFDPEKNIRWKTPSTAASHGRLFLSSPLSSSFSFGSNSLLTKLLEDLTVYCAAGIRLPVEEAATAFEKEFGFRIALNYDSSGAGR